jgi:hypothetical protein
VDAQVAPDRDGGVRLDAEGLSVSVAPDSTVSWADADAGAVVPAAPAPSLGSVTVGGVEHRSTTAALDGDLLRLSYGDAGVKVALRLHARARYVAFEVAEVEGLAVERLAIIDLPLLLKGTPDEPYGACALALNLLTDVPEFPGPSARLRAYCYPRFGLVGAGVAVVAGTRDDMREAMKDAVTEAPDLPHSPVGGPWALDGPRNRSSYLFNFGGLSEQTVDQWIALARSIGFDQIQFHGGSSFRFGDCALDPVAYPNGFESLRAVVDKLHAAGIIAGMQPYAFFIDKRCPWVTPKPDPRLAKDATFTLVEDLPADATSVPVVEPTTGMSTVTGFFVRNSVTLQIDDELIVYSGLSKDAPFAFTQCTRGALGTTAAAHAKGAKVGHLKECFGLFVPDPETTLFPEVAAKTAELANKCGFDAIYLDALDGEDILGGADTAWHYGSAYVFEIAKCLERPTMVEMSTFHHHLWYVRSRMGAWDHPNRCHKQFIDLHLAGNADNARMFLPSNLGWWAFKSWGGPQIEPTFSDDIEYLCAKALGTDSGLSLVTYDANSPGQKRLAETMRRWETLRHSGTVPEAIKARLATPGEDYTLTDAPGGPRFVPVSYAKHSVDLADGTASWEATNRFGAQPVGLRIEALSSVGDPDAPGNTVLADFQDTAIFADRAAAPGVTATLEPLGPQIVWARLSARSSLADRRGSWAKFGRVFSPPLNLSAQQALGVWVYGDAKGELLNFQLRCPSHVVAGLGEHYVRVDFVGWRYCTLVEPDADQWADHAWPYGNAYSIYREAIEYSAVEELTIWVDDLPPGDEVSVWMGPVQALPLATARLVNPSVATEGGTISFPTTLDTGAYLEYAPGKSAHVYGPDGALLADVEPTGAAPLPANAPATVTVTCERQPGPPPRARVTVITRGAPLE